MDKDKSQDNLIITFFILLIGFFPIVNLIIALSILLPNSNLRVVFVASGIIGLFITLIYLGLKIFTFSEDDESNKNNG